MSKLALSILCIILACPAFFKLGDANGNRKLPAGLFIGEARMLTIILKGGMETQSLKTTGPVNAKKHCFVRFIF